MKVSLGVRIGLLVLVALAVVGWLLLGSTAVILHTVSVGTVRAEVLGTGTLEARTSAIVGPKIGGRIVSIAADQGDRVEAGAELVRLEDSDFLQQVAMAESEVAAAQATLDRLAAARRGADAVLTQAQTNYARIEELKAKHVVSEQDLDKAREALSISEAQISEANAALIEGQKRLDAAKRALEYQHARLSETRITAPFAGLVVRRDREPGDVVTPGVSVLQLVSTEQMWITAWVDETELARLAKGQPARVLFRSEPGVAYAGEVARVGREADRETRELVVDVQVEKLPARWAVGQRAEALIEVARRDGVTAIPAALVRVRDGATGVMVDDGGRARWREIGVGLRGRESVEVTSGLAPGEVLVAPATEAAAPLRDGQRIRAK